jgi:hypothetical protein
MSVSHRYEPSAAASADMHMSANLPLPSTPHRGTRIGARADYFVGIA